MKILVVDDDEFVHLLVAVWLAKAGGFDLQFARDGDDALRRVAQRGPFDVVLTDYGHRGPDGLELAKALRQKNPKQGVAMFTGGIPDWVVRSCKDLNIPVMWKPSDGQELPHLLKAAMGKKNRKPFKKKLKKGKGRATAPLTS